MSILKSVAQEKKAYSIKGNAIIITNMALIYFRDTYQPLTSRYVYVKVLYLHD